MRWPPWSSESTNDEKKQEPSSLSSVLPRTPATNNASSALDWNAFIEPRTLIPTVLLTSGILFAVRFHRHYLRRVPDASSISPSWLHRRSVFGQVTSVGDGDNFRIYHTPGGRLAGWGWLPWKKVPTTKKELKDNTVRSLPPGLETAFAFLKLMAHRFTSDSLESTPPNARISVALNSPFLAMPMPGSLPTSLTAAYELRFIDRTNITASSGVYMSAARLISRPFVGEMSRTKC